MEPTIDNRCTTHPSKCDMETALSNPERVLPQAAVDVVVKIISIETTLPNSAVTDNKEISPSSMKRVMAGHTVTNAKKYIDGTVVESNSEATAYKPQPLPKTVVKLPSYVWSKIQQALADLRVLT